MKKQVFVILYNPMMNIFFEAKEGKPALMNGKPINVKKGLLSKGDTVGFVNHKLKKSNVDYSPIISHCIQNSIFVIADVCNTFMSMLIATGKIKCAFITPAHIWDRAAVSIIVRSAGFYLSHFKRPLSECSTSFAPSLYNHMFALTLYARRLEFTQAGNPS